MTKTERDALYYVRASVTQDGGIKVPTFVAAHTDGQALWDSLSKQNYVRLNVDETIRLTDVGVMALAGN